MNVDEVDEVDEADEEGSSEDAVGPAELEDINRTSLGRHL